MPNLPKADPQELLMDSVDRVLLDRKRRAGKNEAANKAREIKIRMSLGWFALVVRAAAKRELTVLAYARRCVMAMTAYDLEMDFHEVMVGEPVPHRNDEPLDGRGHGAWRIQRVDE